MTISSFITHAKKIIVIGGTGETGQRILKYLKQSYPDIFHKLRKPSKHFNPKGYPFCYP